MCTPSIFTMLVRWSVREFASCFLARRFPEDKLAEMNPSPSLKHPTRHIVAEMKDNTGERKISDKNRKRRNHSRTISKSIVSVDNESENSSWIRLPDEEYIVFCFKEDGAFDVTIESNKSERSSSPFNRKIDSTEDTERDELSSDEGRSNEDASEREANATKEQGDEKRGSICWEVELVSASLKRLEESRDSYQSDGSTGSFTFPVLGWESLGSPMRMPMTTSEGISKRKHKTHCMPMPTVEGISTRKLTIRI
ncbi:protein BREAKING OF ASYMMETRY IN THE STOMATAL LINEAGE [Gossypium australe]|uniref:Protein BREAKING OF ASYMMETRY IN THE STOMATAL LINEAGE n=1 Tax=Gossypium australe TaxID=47621 RepID=A0A5B6UE00_9ROSI|nr:protein BREAKING OF ASYMMETRY IN THE STOMATAL LINEAGE [Gossypium australe]